METKKTPKMPFGKKSFDMPAGISSCCGSFMAEMKQFESCCGMAEMMSKAGCDCGTSPDQDASSPNSQDSAGNTQSHQVVPDPK